MNELLAQLVIPFLCVFSALFLTGLAYTAATEFLGAEDGVPIMTGSCIAVFVMLTIGFYQHQGIFEQYKAQIALYTPFILAAIAGAMEWLKGTATRMRMVWKVSILSQSLWFTYTLATESYALLAVNATFTYIFIRNYVLAIKKLPD